MTTPPDPEKPEEPPERRVRRGCLMIIFLLVLVIIFNLIQYGLNIVSIVGAALLVIALVLLFVLGREGRDTGRRT